MTTQHNDKLQRKNSSPAGNCRFAIPKKGRLYEKCVELLNGSGIVFRREDRLDVAVCVGLPITLVFLPAADIAKFVGAGNVDIGITGWDVVKESQVDVERVMDLGFGKCKLCVQAPVEDQITDVSTLAGGRIVTSYPDLTKEFFKPFDDAKGVQTNVRFVGGSVEAACGLGLADAVVDLVETGTTMRVRKDVSIIYRCWKAQSNRLLFVFTDRLLDWRSSMTFLRLRLSLFPTKIPSMLIL
jgi:ATP phosphoribosyltransferase